MNKRNAAMKKKAAVPAVKHKVRIGIVGSKFAAGFHADSYRRNEHAELSAVAAIDNLPEFSKQWKIPHVYADYKEMFKRDDLDLISVCVPNFLHHGVVLAAARAGKHIVCEKPFATSLADAEEMIKVCRQNGVKLFYAEDWVFTPALRRVEQVISEGGIGKIFYVKAKECHNGTHSPFAKKKETCGGGCLIHLAVHPVGWVLHLLGDGGRNKVVEVTGQVNGGLQDNYVHKENGGEDFSLGVMKFADGQRAFVEGNYITLGGMEDQVEIYGSAGLIKTDLTLSSNVEVYSRPGYSYAVEKADNTVGWTRPAVDEFYNLGYVDELAYAVDCVRTGQDPKYGCSGALGKACIGIIEAMYKSSMAGKTIRGEWG
jgi:predicted dehydrogenase